MKRKQVLFEDHEEFILEHAMKQESFSEYVKLLIKEDMQTVRQMPKPSIYEIYNNKTKPFLKI